MQAERDNFFTAPKQGDVEGVFQYLGTFDWPLLSPLFAVFSVIFFLRIYEFATLFLVDPIFISNRPRQHPQTPIQFIIMCV